MEASCLLFTNMKLSCGDGSDGGTSVHKVSCTALKLFIA